MFTLIVILATIHTNLILADALSCSSPNLVVNIKAVAAAAGRQCDEKYCGLWMSIEIGYIYPVQKRYESMSWLTLLEEHNDELNSGVTKQFNASVVFTNYIPAKFAIRITVRYDDGGGSGWSQTISNTKELFHITASTDKDEVTNRMILDRDYYVDHDTSPEHWVPGVKALSNLTNLRDVLEKRGSFIYLRSHPKYKCLINDCNPGDLRLIMRINAVVALKELCDPGSSAGSACDIWMKIEIGFKNRLEPGSHAAANQTTTWRTMLVEHDYVLNRQISRVFSGHTIFNNLDEMPKMYTLKISVRDDDDRHEMWSESFNTAEPVVQFTGQFEGPKNGSDSRSDRHRLYHSQAPFKNRRRRSLRYDHYTGKGLSSKNKIQQDLMYSHKSFVELFVRTEKGCTTNSQNRYYLHICASVAECA